MNLPEEKDRLISSRGCKRQTMLGDESLSSPPSDNILQSTSAEAGTAESGVYPCHRSQVPINMLIVGRAITGIVLSLSLLLRLLVQRDYQRPQREKAPEKL